MCDAIAMNEVNSFNYLSSYLSYVLLQILTLFLQTFFKWAFLRKFHDKRKFLLTQLKVKKGHNFGVYEFFQPRHKLQIAWFENVIIGLVLQLIDDLNGVFLLISLVDTAIDSPVMTHADKFFPLVHVDSQRIHIFNALLRSSAAHFQLSLILVIKY